MERPSDAIYAAMGEEAIVAMMEAFYAELAQSPTLRHVPADTPGAGIHAAHRSAAFFIGIMGGPPLYQQMYGNPAVPHAICPSQIDEAARHEWLRCFNVVLAIGALQFPARTHARLPGLSGWLLGVDGEHRPARSRRGCMSTETISRRPWAGPQDTEAIRALLRLRYWQQGPPSYPSASDFDYWLATTGNRAVPQGIQLWFDGDQLVGYVWPADNELDCIVHPRTHAALPAMVA